MKLQYLAHAAFLLTAEDGVTLLTDPYESNGYDGAIAYAPIDEQADIITISHEHADHNYISPMHDEAKIIRGIGECDVRGIQIRGFSSFHDEKQGAERGQNTIFTISMDGLTLCHLGDLGHLLADGNIKELGSIDVLMLPVGGVFTTDAKMATAVMEKINPKICIPMHYKTDKLGFDLASVDVFLAGKNNVKFVESSEVELTQEMLPVNCEIWSVLPSKL